MGLTSFGIGVRGAVEINLVRLPLEEPIDSFFPGFGNDFFFVFTGMPAGFTPC
jgi:hypothetical protein